MPKVIVCIKQSVNVQNLKFDASTKQPMLTGAPRKMSDMDKRALEEAIRLKEKAGWSVTVFTVGPPEAKETVKEAYAMGADEGWLIVDDLRKGNDAYLTAKALAAAAKSAGGFDLVLCGSASTDNYTWETGGRLAELLGLPFLNSAAKLSVDQGTVVVSCQFEDGTYTFTTNLPAVVAVTLDINEPRIPPLSAALKAARMPLKTVKTQDLGVSIQQTPVNRLEVRALETTRRGIVFDGSDESKLAEAVRGLLDSLRRDGRIGG